MLSAIVPLARTPMDKKMASSLKSYGKNVDRAIKNIAPWTRRKPRDKGIDKDEIKSGDVVVMLDSNDDPNNPLFEDAKVKYRGK